MKTLAISGLMTTLIAFSAIGLLSAETSTLNQLSNEGLIDSHMMASNTNMADSIKESAMLINLGFSGSIL